MKNIVFLMFLSMSNLFAQQVDYNTIILPEGIDNIDISEKLVRLDFKKFPALSVTFILYFLAFQLLRANKI